MYAWRVAAVKPLAEFTAEDQLSRQGFQAFNPRCAVSRVQQGRRVTTEVPYIRGYIFVNLDTEREGWQRVNNTRGVRRLLPETSEVPSPVDQRMMDVLIGKCSGSGLMEARHVDAAVSKLIPVGGTVKITQGAFEGFEAPVEWSNDERVTVLLSMLGGRRPVQVQRSDVELVG